MTAPATMSWLGYGWESTFGTASTTIDKPFGHGTRVTGLSRKNNIEKVYSNGYRNAQKMPVKKYEGALTMEWVLANPWFFRGFLGSTADSGSGPYDHTFTESDTVESFTVSNNVGMESAYKYDLLGCKFNTINITSAVNELVRVRADIPFVNESPSGTTSSKIAESFDLYTYAQGSFELPGGTTLAMVQNIDLTLGNNPEPVSGQGSRFAQEAPVKNSEYSATVTMALQAHADLLQKFYGSASGPSDTVAEQATMKMTFTNGLTGTSERTIDLTFTGAKIDEDSLPQDPTQVIMEDVKIDMRSLQVVATDNTTTVQ